MPFMILPYRRFPVHYSVNGIDNYASDDRRGCP